MYLLNINKNGIIKKIDESILNNITSNIDILLKNVYERKISIEDLFSKIKECMIYPICYLIQLKKMIS